MFIAGLFSGVIIIGAFFAFVFPRLIFSVSESKFDFSQTAETLIESAGNNSWSILHQYDLQETMTKKGYEVKPVKVFSICKPDISYRILKDDNNRHVSAMMPCRVTIYEKADGKTYISRMNVGLFAKLLGGKASAVMVDAYRGSEDVLKTIEK